jgi:hypothetical protein
MGKVGLKHPVIRVSALLVNRHTRYDPEEIALTLTLFHLLLTVLGGSHRRALLCPFQISRGPLQLAMLFNTEC